MTCGRNARICRTSALGRLSHRHQGEAALGQRRQRVALGQPGVDEAEEPLLHAEDLARPRHLRPAGSGAGSPRISGRSIALFRMSPRSPPVSVQTSTSTPSRDVAGHGRRALAGLVVRVRVHGHQPQRPGAIGVPCRTRQPAARRSSGFVRASQVPFRFAVSPPVFPTGHRYFRTSPAMRRNSARWRRRGHIPRDEPRLSGYIDPDRWRGAHNLYPWPGIDRTTHRRDLVTLRGLPRARHRQARRAAGTAPVPAFEECP